MMMMMMMMIRIRTVPFDDVGFECNFEESSAERQRNAEAVEDLRKQLSKAAAEACLHWLALAMSHCLE